MRLRLPSLRHAEPRAVLLAAGVSAIGIFALDTITDVDIQVAYLYSVVLLMISDVLPPRGLLLAASGCALLTVAGHFGGPGDVWGRPALINLSFVLASIAFTAFILWRNWSAELALRELRNQLAHLMRVTHLGELTASISHEVNQPLAGVVANGHACLRWLAAQPPNLEEARQAVERIVRDGNRADAVIQRVRAMAKRSPPQTSWVDINDTIQEVMALARGEVERRRASLRTELSSGLSPVPGDRIQLQQVILNLVLNALEAIDANGAAPRTIEIETGREGATDVRVTVRVGPQALEQVFDAFYTTKPDGLGMGLAISRSIIQAHDGRLWATPNTPRGAVFQFTLPAHRQTNTSAERTQSADDGVRGAGAIQSAP